MSYFLLLVKKSLNSVILKLDSSCSMGLHSRRANMSGPGYWHGSHLAWLVAICAASWSSSWSSCHRYEWAPWSPRVLSFGRRKSIVRLWAALLTAILSTLRFQFRLSSRYCIQIPLHLTHSVCLRDHLFTCWSARLLMRNQTCIEFLLGQPCSR